MPQSLAEALAEAMALKITAVRGEMDGLLKIKEVPTLFDRDAIPLAQRSEGMWVKVINPDSIWSLVGGLDNDFWVDKFPLDSVPGGAPTQILLSHLSEQVRRYFVPRADMEAALAQAQRKTRRRTLLEL